MTYDQKANFFGTPRGEITGICFLNASKTFDRVNHSLLFKKQIKQGVCGYLLKIMK